MHIKITESVSWVGVFDWNLRNFHGVATPKGGTYNAYIVADGGEGALIETAYGPFRGELMRNISEVIDPKRLGHIIVNHAEPDHSSAISAVLEEAPGADVVCTARCKEFLEHQGVTARFTVVKEGDRLRVGGKTLSFTEAPMLHWPEVMWTFLEEERVLFPCDMFGTQAIQSNMAAEEMPDIEQHIKRYFAFIFRPLSAAVIKGLERAERLQPSLICPSHGPVWRDAARIQGIYRRLATRPEREKALIIYASIWGDVDRMAKAIADGVGSTGVEVALRDVGDLSWQGWSDLLAEAMEAKGIAVGSLTVLGGIFPQLSYATMLLRLVKAKGKVGLSFGAYGWGPGITKKLDEELAAIEAKPYREGIEVRFKPTDKDLERCRDAGRELGERIMGVKL
ncbi:MAG TPA: FprA family A-type flavoprotein [Candidatus Methanomethylicus sp.]|nr:FprA family A-type flavoprotein [Candidatus Methanomethylicus sp.]